MKSLLKEFSRGDIQQDLKNSDGSDAGRNDMAAKPVDIKFSLMRNMINNTGAVTGSDVNDYLERAHDLNDEVDTVGFAIETDNGDLIKVYVNAQQADEFEAECSKLLGLDDDSEAAINTLAQKFDIVDVVWPQDPNVEGGEEGETADPYDDVSIDDDPSSFMGDETDTSDTADADAAVDSVDTDGEDETDLGDALPADAEDTDAEPKPKKKSLMKDIAGDPDSEESDETDEADGEDVDSADKTDGDKKKKEPKASADDEAMGDADVDSGVGPEEIVADDEEGEEEPELDADGNPVKKEKKAKKKDGEKEVTEEGLIFKKLANLVEGLRDDVNAHVDQELAKRANKSGKYVIDCLMTGGTLGRRQYLYQEEGDVKYFDTMEEAESTAKDLSAKRNHAMARAHYSFTPRMVEEIDQEDQEDEMIGSKFLQRVTEAEETNVIKDTVWNGIHNRMKRPYDKKIVEFFNLLGIPGRYVRGEEGLEDGIRAGGDILRRAGRKQSTFNAFFDALQGGGAGPVAEAKKGSRLQKILETVMVTLGFPASLVSAGDMPGPLNSMIRRAAAKIEADSNLEAALLAFAKALGLSSKQVNEGSDQYTSAKAGKRDAENDHRANWTDFDPKKDPKGTHLRAYIKSAIGASDEYLDAYVKRTLELVKVNEAKAFKVREPGWYVVDHMDKPVDGPYSEGNAKKEAKEMSKEHAAKHGKGDISAFDAVYFSDYDIKRMHEGSVLGAQFMQRVLGEEVDVGQDDFMEAVMKLVLALGIPEGILQPRRQMIIRALREKKQTLTNRGMLQQRMMQLISLIEKGTKATPSTGTVEESLREARMSLTESKLFEAFGPLEAVVGKSLEMLNAEEPAAGPAMWASYEGSGAHEETILVLAVDPDADDDNKSLRVGIDSPWDGGIHAKYFPNNKEGYKAAVDYANMLRTCNLKKGGRPKGWKDSAPSVSRMSDDMREDPMQRGRNAAEMGRGPSAKDFE